MNIFEFSMEYMKNEYLHHVFNEILLLDIYLRMRMSAVDVEALAVDFPDLTQDERQLLADIRRSLIFICNTSLILRRGQRLFIYVSFILTGA